MKIDEIQNDIKAKIPTAVSLAQEEVYKIMNNVLQKFYAEYTPNPDNGGYIRTFQMLKSCVKVSVVTTVHGAKAEVKFDPSTMNYVTGARPSGAQVLGAANLGMHGALGLHMEQGSTRIHTESDETVARFFLPMMKQALIQAGISVK